MESARKKSTLQGELVLKCISSFKCGSINDPVLHPDSNSSDLQSGKQKRLPRPFPTFSQGLIPCNGYLSVTQQMLLWNGLLLTAPVEWIGYLSFFIADCPPDNLRLHVSDDAVCNCMAVQRRKAELHHVHYSAAAQIVKSGRRNCFPLGRSRPRGIFWFCCAFVCAFHTRFW